MNRLLTATLIPFFALVSLSLQAEVPKKADLDVLFIEQWPVYPGYGFSYPGNLPVLVKPGTGVPGKPPVYYYTRDEYEANVKTHPVKGEEITFTAFVANKGGVKVGKSDYLFKMDGKVMKKGELPALEPGEKTSVQIKWPYELGRHFVSFEADPNNKSEEICKANNKREDPTFGFVLTITAGNKGEYPAFGNTENMVGSYSFEDWCQAHIDKWREYFRDAKYPSTPDGVQAGVRFNYIFPEDEGAELKAYNDKGGWCNWRIYWDIDKIPQYAKGIDGGLIHELVHQCGVIDSYQIGFGLLDNLALDPETGKTIEIPYSDHRCAHSSIMGGAYRYEIRGAFSEDEAAAFDATMKRWNNHAGYGLYLFDMPESNYVQFLNNRGEPLAGAALTIFQEWASPYEMNEASRKTNIVTPKQVRLDDEGKFNLGANPYDTLWVVGGNCVIMYCVRAYGQKEYHFVDMREFNLACWRGDEKAHTYVYQTNIAPIGSPAPVRNLKVVPAESERTKAVLTWDAPNEPAKKIVKYRVRWNLDWKSALHEPTYETAEEVGADVRKVAIEFPQRQGYIWFTVTAVADDGTESRAAEPVVWPEVEQVKMGLVRPIGTAIAPDGAMYVIDNHLGTIYGVDAKGNLINMSDTAPIGSGAIMAITVTPSGRIFVAARYDQGILEIDAKEYKVVHQFGESKRIGQGQGNFAYPYSIVSDQKNRLFVMYPATSKIEVYDPDGKHLGTIEDKFDDAREIAVTSNGDRTTLAVPEFNARKVTVLELDPESFRQLGKTTIDSAVTPLATCFDDSGRLYVGTQAGIDRYESGKKTGHWESKYNDKGHQVWGIAIRGGQMICSEGSDNEKYWMKGSFDDFKPVADR
jgi:sugar lactone lactonase YvrE